MLEKNVITGKFSPGKAETIQRNVELQIKPTKRVNFSLNFISQILCYLGKS